MKRFVGPSMGALLVTALALGACASVGAPSVIPSPTLPPSESPPLVTRATPTAGPPSSPSAPALTPGSRWTWVQTGIPMRAVSAGGPGWVGVGAFVPPQDPGSELSVPAAWTSVDGRTWDRSEVALPSGARDGEMTLVARGPQGLVAAGMVGLTMGTVWRSDDGRTWDVIGTGSLFDLGPCFEGCASMTSIAAGPAGIVVSGYRVSKNLEADVWASVDGSAWRRVPLPAPSQTSLRVSADTSIVVTPSGFLAVGSVCRSDGTACRAVTWTSRDGVEWKGPTNLPSSAGSRGVRAVADGSRVVVLGERCKEDCWSIAWSSTDEGATWTAGDLTAAEVRTTWRGLLTIAGDRFIFIGFRGKATEVWSSADGVAWTREALEAGSFAASSALFFADLAGRIDSALAIGDIGEGGQIGAWTSP